MSFNFAPSFKSFLIISIDGDSLMSSLSGLKDRPKIVIFLPLKFCNVLVYLLLLLVDYY